MGYKYPQVLLKRVSSVLKLFFGLIWKKKKVGRKNILVEVGFSWNFLWRKWIPEVLDIKCLRINAPYMQTQVCTISFKD